MNLLRIGLAQTKQVGDLEINAESIFRFVDMAGERGVQILCFPESQTAGYRCDIADPNLPSPVQRLDELHAEVARRCQSHQMACILGTETPNPAGKPYNSAIVFNEDGKTLGVHHKTKLTPLDATVYSPGQSIETYDLFGIRIGVLICFEAFRFAETTAECVRQGAQVVFHPQNNTTRPNDWKIPIHHAMITTRAGENTIWFASCNAALAPHQNSRSLVIAPDGRVHAQTQLNEEELLVTEIDVDLATRAMFTFDTESCAPVLFSDTVHRDEFAEILPESNIAKVAKTSDRIDG